MKNISKMDRNGNEIDKALDEALNVLHRKSELAEDELRDRMKDDVWRELCADLAECERVVTEDECRANHDVDKLWNQFKEQMEKGEQKRYHHIFLWVVGCTGLVSFLYLELIDASFSLDGVLGAFALSKDIIIISIGLAIGAMFVRSLTIMLVEKKTLKQFLYLEHGAHWAIGALACLMLVSTVKEIPEIVTGGIGLGFILAALASSILHNKKQERLLAEEKLEGQTEENA